MQACQMYKFTLGRRFRLSGKIADDVQNLAWHVDKAGGGRLWHKGLDPGQGKRGGAYVFLGGLGRHLDPIADLAIHLDDDYCRLVARQVLAPTRPRLLVNAPRTVERRRRLAGVGRARRGPTESAG